MLKFKHFFVNLIPKKIIYHLYVITLTVTYWVIRHIDRWLVVGKQLHFLRWHSWGFSWICSIIQHFEKCRALYYKDTTRINDLFVQCCTYKLNMCFLFQLCSSLQWCDDCVTLAHFEPLQDVSSLLCLVQKHSFTCVFKLHS